MSADGANNHPMLAWGSTSHKPFIFPKPIQEEELELPLKIKFRKPFPKKTEIADILFLSGDFAMSEKVKNLFEKMNIYGVQFWQAEITTDKSNIITGHYAFHLWNCIAAVDKNNYKGALVTERGLIDSLKSFSLDEKVLSEIPLEKRLVFYLTESNTERLVHQSVYDAMMAENLTGFSFIRVADWDEDAMFR
jgi:hypothetical protein